MSSISTSAYYNVSSSASDSGGISGLMSGMDTDQMVEDMLAGTQAKIDVQKGLQTQAEWKQEIYRDIIGQINDFSDKYFNSSYGATGSNNFLSADFFNNMISSVTSGDAVKIIGASPDAMIGNLDVIVNSLATSSKLKDTGHTLSGDNSITGESKYSTSEGVVKDIFTNERLTELFNKDLNLSVNGTTVNINLNGISTNNELVDKLNSELSSSGITVSEKSGGIVFSGEANVSVLDTSSDLALAVTGLKEGAIQKGDIFRADPNAGITLDITFDGISKSITISDIDSTDSIIDKTEFLDALNQKINTAFGGYIEASYTADNALSFGFASGIDSSGHSISISGADATLLGIKPGSSSTFSTSKTLSELATGDRFDFTINGVDFSFDGDTTVATMISEINRSDAGVKVHYSTLEDKMKIEASSTGKLFGIEMSQSAGNILSSLFGDSTIANASSTYSNTLTTTTISGKVIDDFSIDAETPKTMSFEVNDKTYAFTLPAKGKDETYTHEEVSEELNKWLTSTFGRDLTTGNANISYENGVLSVNDGFIVEFKKSDIDTTDTVALKEAAKLDLGVALGFTIADKTDNIATSSTKVSELAGITSSIDSSIEDYVASLSLSGANASFVDGKIKIDSTASGIVDISSTALADIFGNNSLSFSDGAMAADMVDVGSDAELVINGISTTRSSNTFVIEGVTIQATKVSASGESTTINTVRNEDAIVDTVKTFIEDYNKLIEELNGHISEEASYKDYPPLSQAQKKEMSDSEIELWEEKAKEGLLRNDSDISSFLSEMRLALYTTPEGSDIAMYQIGIETTNDYEDNGKLQFDETAFRNALSSDPVGVADLFANPIDGIAKQFENATKRVANESSGSPGTLVSLAGLQGYASEDNNTLTSNINSILDRISVLEARYEVEKTRYWAQFSAMETVLSQYNSQSMMLTQQFGSYY